MLNPIVKSSTSIGMFKSRLRTEIFSVDQHCFDYNYLGTRKVNALLATMRTRCSVLKHDLFKNNIINSASCDCGKSDETYFHYFFECEYYTAIRDAFLQETIFINHLNVHTILNGSSDISREENLKLHKAVSAFILLSNRF